jgi:FixJ family two-component response regulator
MIPNAPIRRALLNRDRLVHIVDANAGTCQAMSMLFRLEGFQTASSTDAAAFYAALERRAPDVVVLDSRVSPEDGIPALRRIRAKRANIPVFMLANAPDAELAVRAMKAGAADVLIKPISTGKLIGLVLDSLRLDTHLDLAEGTRRLDRMRNLSQLTAREREVLRLITYGRTNKEAGRDLGISHRTIEVHRARVMEKLGARNTADLLRIVLTE